MGLFDRIFGKDQKNEKLEIDPLSDLVLAKLRVGYMVDYDMKSWHVTAYGRYDWNDGATAEEWELTSGREKVYLEREEDDGEWWSLSRTISLASLGGEVRSHVLEHDDPPDEVIFKGKTYYLEGSVGGVYRENGTGPEQELIQWEMLTEDEESFLSIVQWSETEVSAAAGHEVEEYQFSSILPGGGAT